MIFEVFWKVFDDIWKTLDEVFLLKEKLCEEWMSFQVNEFDGFENIYLF